jgi:phage gp36-like protein
MSNVHLALTRFRIPHSAFRIPHSAFHIQEPPMSYATPADLAARLAPDVLQTLADDDGDSLPDTPVLEAALADATAEIDQKLAGRYLTPVAPAPPILTRWCADLAAATLFVRRRQPIPLPQAEALALTRRTLAAIADGLAGLAGAIPRPADFLAENTLLDEPPAFSEETLAPF